MKTDMKQLLEAYEILGAEDTRKAYDESLNCDINDLVKSASEGNVDNRTINENVPMFARSDSEDGGRKNDPLSYKVDPTQLQWAMRVIWGTFLLVFVPKLVYICYHYYFDTTGRYS